MVYTLTLNPALDYVIKTGALRYDDINRAESDALYYGGKGINVSAVLTRLGVDSTALGFAAGFTGRQLETMLRDDGIRCDFCYLNSGMTRINVKIRADAELDINAGGPAIGEADLAALFQKLDGIGEGDLLVLAGAVPKTLPDDIYERILRRLDGRGIRTAVDAAGELLTRTLPYRPFLIKPNHHELGDLFGVTLTEERDIAHYAAVLQKRGARNVLVSRAAHGALLLDETGAVRTIGAVCATPVNSVGSGDSMVAGFLAGYLQTGDYAEALRLGAACGTATVFSDGLAEKAAVDRYYAALPSVQ